MESVEQVALVDVKDLVLIGEALPFRVLDCHARMLLYKGHWAVPACRMRCG